MQELRENQNMQTQINIYHADDGNAEIEIEAETALGAAREYVETGDWGDDRTETVWIDILVWEEGETREDGEWHTITLDPEEPECNCEDGHDWQTPYSILGGMKENPGVWGPGGGVVYNEVCMHCGCQKQTDTWAQRPDTGEQGLYSVKYTAGHYAEELKADTIKWIGSDAFDDAGQDELENAFRIMFDREPDHYDREEGLASHLCTFL